MRSTCRISNLVRPQNTSFVALDGECERTELEVVNHTEVKIMLALSRKVGQTIVIDNQITVTILSIRGNRITLGIDAPREVSIHREELVTTVFASSLLTPTLESVPAQTQASR